MELFPSRFLYDDFFAFLGGPPWSLACCSCAGRRQDSGTDAAGREDQRPSRPLQSWQIRAGPNRLTRSLCKKTDKGSSSAALGYSLQKAQHMGSCQSNSVKTCYSSVLITQEGENLGR